MSRIKEVKARQITDSRGDPTVEAKVYLESGAVGWAAVPSGASTGEREAVELRDKDPSVYRGKGVSQAVTNINTKINLALRRQSAAEQRKIDQILLDLDGTKFKSKFGANALLAVSLAVADGAAKESVGEERLFEYIAHLHGKGPGRTLPVPLINVVNGGKHADNYMRLQEFMIVPVGAKSLWDALKIGSRVFHEIGTLVERIQDNPAVGIGDEGGYSPMLCPGHRQEQKVRAALDLIMRGIDEAHLLEGADVVLALDAAASEFFDEKKGLYNFYCEDETTKVLLSSDELIDFYEQLVSDYPICSIEDGVAEKDEQGWLSITKRLGKKVQLVGDDVFVTNPEIFRAGIQKGMANSILIKVNQIGTLSETLDTIALAEENGYTCIVSHRSGETLDTKIADLAVGCNTGQIKTGSMSRGERIAKYNRLKEIEFLLEESADYPGWEVFDRFPLRRLSRA